MPTPTPSSSPPFLTVAEVAALLCVSDMTVHRLIRAGELPAYQFGRQFRLDPADVDAYITRQRVAS